MTTSKSVRARKFSLAPIETDHLRMLVSLSIPEEDQSLMMPVQHTEEVSLSSLSKARTLSASLHSSQAKNAVQYSFVDERRLYQTKSINSKEEMDEKARYLLKIFEPARLEIQSLLSSMLFPEWQRTQKTKRISSISDFFLYEKDLKNFRAFLRTRLAEENILFLQAVRNYETRKGTAAEIKLVAMNIFRDFIEDDALNSVNIGADVKQKLRHLLFSKSENEYEESNSEKKEIILNERPSTSSSSHRHSSHSNTRSRSHSHSRPNRQSVGSSNSQQLSIVGLIPLIPESPYPSTSTTSTTALSSHKDRPRSDSGRVRFNRNSTPGGLTSNRISSEQDFNLELSTGSPTFLNLEQSEAKLTERKRKQKKHSATEDVLFTATTVADEEEIITIDDLNNLHV